MSHGIYFTFCLFLLIVITAQKQGKQHKDVSKHSQVFDFICITRYGDAYKI